MTNSKKRKFLATSLTATMVAAAVAPAAGFAAEADKKFDDLGSYESWAGDSISYLVAKGAVHGVGDNKYNPGGKLTRAAAAKILAISLGLEIDENAKSKFTDVSGWAEPYVAAIENLDIIEGVGDNKFNPSEDITRGAMAKMIVKAYGLKLDENADVNFPDNNVSWSKDHLEILASQGIVQGNNGKIDPLGKVTRAQGAVFVHRAEVKEVRKDVPQKEVEAPAVESVSAINNADRSVTVIGTAKDAESVEITVNNSTSTAPVNEDGKFELVTEALPLGTHTVSVVAVKGESKSSAKTTKVTVEAEVATGVAGYVTLDTDDFGNPVTNHSGIKVTVDGKTATTDRSGFFQLPKVTPGNHVVTIEKDGYLTKKLEGSDRARVLDGKTSVVFDEIENAAQAKADITIEANVVDSVTKGALADATHNGVVTLERFDSVLEDWVEVEEKNLTSGSFNFDNTSTLLNFGEKYRLTVSKAYDYDYGTNEYYAETDPDTALLKPYHTYQQEITLSKDAKKNELSAIQLDAVKTIEISGSLENAAGEAITGEDVVLVAADGETEIADVTTDVSTGEFKFEDIALPTGKYFLKTEITSGGDTTYQVYPISVTEGTDITGKELVASSSYDVELTLGLAAPSATFKASSKVDVKILTKDGALVEEYKEEELDAGNKTYTVGVATDKFATGEYVAVVSGDYVVEQEIPFSVKKPASGTKVEKDGILTTAGTVAGNVTDAPLTGTAATALEDATVWLVDKDGKVIADAKTDASGNYTFTGVAAGKYTVKAYKHGYESTANEKSFDVKANEDTNKSGGDIESDNVDLELKALDLKATVEGVIRNEGTLATADDGLFISYYNAANNLVYQDELDSGDGTYTMADFSAGSELDPGAYKVVIRGTDYETFATTITVNRGDEIDNANYEVVKNVNQSTVKYTIVDEHNRPLQNMNVKLIDEHADTSTAAATNEKGIKEVANTNAKGEASFSNVSAGEYTVEVTGNIGGLPITKVTKAYTIGKGEDRQLVIPVSSVDNVVYDVNLQVVDEDGAKVVGTGAGAVDTSVLVFDAKGDLVSTATRTLNATGQATLRLPNGNYTVKVLVDRKLVSEKEVTVKGANQTLSVIQVQDWN